MASKVNQGDLNIRDLFFRKANLIGTTEATSDSYVELNGNLIKISSTETTYTDESGSAKWNLYVKRSNALINTSVDRPQITVEPSQARLDTNITVTGALTLSGGTRGSPLRLDVSGNVVGSSGYQIVSSASDLPSASGGVISLSSDTTYVMTSMIELNGSRLVCGANSVLLGREYGSCGLMSGGLTSGALVSATHSVSLQNLTLMCDSSGTNVSAVHFDASNDVDARVELIRVRFVDCASVGVIRGYGEFVYGLGALVNSGGLTLDGVETYGRVTDVECLGRSDVESSMVVMGSWKGLSVAASRFDVPFGCIGVNVDALTTIPDESFVMTSCMFDGSGTYVSGVSSSMGAFALNRGVSDSRVCGHMYSTSGGSETVTSAMMRIGSVTTAIGSLTSRFDHSTNRLTCRSSTLRTFKVMATISTDTPVMQVGVYASRLGQIVVVSHATVMCLVEMHDGDYIELWYGTGDSSLTVTTHSMSLMVTEV